MPRGVTQERIEKHTACDIVSCAYDIILKRYEIYVLYYLWQHAYHTAAETGRRSVRWQGGGIEYPRAGLPAKLVVGVTHFLPSLTRGRETTLLIPPGL